MFVYGMQTPSGASSTIRLHQRLADGVAAKPLKLKGRERSKELNREVARSQRRVRLDGALARVHHISDKV